MFSWYFRINLLVRIMSALVLGIIVGLYLAYNPGLAKPFIAYTKFFGDLFINLLKMIIVPTIFLSLIGGASSITPTQLGRVGVKTLLYYFVTSIIAIGIALLLANLLQPGLGLNITGAASVAGRAAKTPGFGEVLMAIIPQNPVASLAKGDVLPIIFFALSFGIALSFLRDHSDGTIKRQADTLFDAISVAAEAMYVVVRGIMQYAPIGVFVLISIVFAQQGAKVVGPLVFLTFVVYLGLVLHLVIGYGGALLVFKMSFFKFLRGANEAMLTAFCTRSSNATLPISMRVADEKLGVPRGISSFALPIGATVNMDGTAIYLAVCTMFIGNAVGKPLTMDQQFMVMLTATLAAIGAAGVPGAGALMMLMVLETVGLPVEAGSAVAACYAMILGMDALFDMGRTGMNVTGDIVGVCVVAKVEGELDESKWA